MILVSKCLYGDNDSSVIIIHKNDYINKFES